MGILDRIEQLQIDRSEIIQVWQVASQVSSECPTIDKWHHQVEQALFIAKLNQRENMGVVKLGNRASLAIEATTHLRIAGIVTKDDLDGYATPESGALPSFVDSTHAPYTDAPDDIVVSKRLAFQSEHRMLESFSSRHSQAGTWGYLMCQGYRDRWSACP